MRANLAAVNDTNKVAIAEAGGIAPLVELARSGSDVGAAHRAGAQLLRQAVQRMGESLGASHPQTLKWAQIARDHAPPD